MTDLSKEIPVPATEEEEQVPSSTYFLGAALLLAVLYFLFMAFLGWLDRTVDKEGGRWIIKEAEIRSM